MDTDDALSIYPGPGGLGRLGAALWEHLTTEFEWRFDELLLIERAARLTDVIERREREIAMLPDLTSTDARGNPVDHPLASGLARDVNALRLLLSHIGVPSGSAIAKAPAPARSVAARKAAAARWDKAGA